MIRAEEVGRGEFRRLFTRHPHLFNTPGYAELYGGKCRKIHYICIHGSRPLAGIIAGERDGRLQSPFSAPYGGLTIGRRLHLPELVEVCSAFDRYAREAGLGMRVTLPPLFHDPSAISSQAYAFGLVDGIDVITDVNFHIPLQPPPPMAPAAAGAARRAERYGLEFSPLTLSESNILRAYSIIEANHLTLGYPMNVSAHDMVRTCLAVNAELFTVNDGNGNDVAAAIVYRPRPQIAQPVGWGDIPAFRGMRPMTYLARALSIHYSHEGLEAIDLGPSSIEGRPQPGLCFFKETLGCETSLKFTFIR